MFRLRANRHEQHAAGSARRKKKQKKKRLKTAPESISLYPLSPFSANVHVHGDV